MTLTLIKWERPHLWNSHPGGGWGVPFLCFPSGFCAHQHWACGCCHSRVLFVTRFTKVFSRIDMVAIAFGDILCWGSVLSTSSMPTKVSQTQELLIDTWAEHHPASQMLSLLSWRHAMACMWRSEDSCATGSLFSWVPGIKLLLPGLWGYFLPANPS